MVYMCAICSVRQPPLVALTREHRNALEALVSSSVDLERLSKTVLLACRDCTKLVQRVAGLQGTALAGVNHLLSHLPAVEAKPDAAVLPEKELDDSSDDEPQQKTAPKAVNGKLPAPKIKQESSDSDSSEESARRLWRQRFVKPEPVQTAAEAESSSDDDSSSDSSDSDDRQSDDEPAPKVQAKASKAAPPAKKQESSEDAGPKEKKRSFGQDKAMDTSMQNGRKRKASGNEDSTPAKTQYIKYVKCTIFNYCCHKTGLERN